MAARPRRYTALAAMEQIMRLSDEESDSEENVSDVDEDEHEMQVPEDGDGGEEEEMPDDEEEEALAPLAQRLSLGRLTSPNGRFGMKGLTSEEEDRREIFSEISQGQHRMQLQDFKMNWPPFH